MLEFSIGERPMHDDGGLVVRPVRWRLRAGALLIAMVLIGCLGFGLHRSQADSRNALKDRFGDRARTSSQFVSTYVSQLFDRERSVATQTMSGLDPTTTFTAAVHAFGFRAAVLLDSHGRAIALAPAAPKMIGTPIASKYPHLLIALRGDAAVSPVVTSAVEGIPVGAFAVPFDTPHGRRVFSGAYAVTDTPLGAFLDNTLTIANSRVYIVDRNHMVVASNGRQAPAVRSLQQRDAALADVSRWRSRGYADTAAGRYYFAEQTIGHTPWSLLMAVPAAEWFAPVSGAGQIASWVVLGVLAVLMLVAAWLASRLVEGRRQLRTAYGQLVDAHAHLEEVARSDELTGLFNRRHLNEHIEAVLAGARRHGFPVSVLMIDIDNFKRLNDTFGHQAGDVAIQHVARQLSGGLRTEDLIGRWGGEEFLAILPHADASAAVEVAERLRRVVATEPVELGNGGDLVELTISIGVAEYAGDHPDVWLHRADLALYDAKAGGRNTVATSAR